ncbi:GDP-mannose 4,6-dehydratase [Patescibacteria group bacterium AH-259-L07]|nr:GDP-mannose 4,6-dehydratase [Patescibacteria group bacterium AH-259-L07]
MKYLITGGAGFIGSHLVKQLLEQNREVVCLDNFNTFYDPKIKEKNIAQATGHPNFILIRGDILDAKLLDKIFKKYKIKKIIHLAALAGVRPSFVSPLKYVETDVNGTICLLEKAKDYNVEQFIFASSSSIYGINKKVPFSENDNVDLQISPYASAKKAAEVYCRTYHHLYKIPITILRFFTVYGPCQRPDMAIHKFARLIHQNKPIQMYGDGSSQRDYTYIDDIITGIMSVLDKSFDFEIFNLGNSETTSLKNLIELIGSLIGKTPEIKKLPDQPGDVPITYANISRAKKMLGYQPKVPIEKGIESFIQWYQNSFTGYEK